MKTDYYDKKGCCLVCNEAKEGCLCYECKCRNCYWYEYDSHDKGHCNHPDSSYSKNEWNDSYHEYIWIGNIKKETEKALYCELVDIEDNIMIICWVPKLVLTSPFKGALIKNWWLMKKDIIDYE